MLLADLHSASGAADTTRELWPLLGELYPLCRSITGNGVRQTLDRMARYLPFERTEVPSGTPAFDWEIPREWNVRDAYVAEVSGRRVIDFQQHSLHLLNYSVPVRKTMTLEELQPHLYSLPQQPDWIPYRTSYYREQWGFCLRHRDRIALGPGPYEVVIDSTLAPGSLTYAEHRVPGTGNGEAIVYTHTCHPSLANDNLTGLVAALALARAMKMQKPRLTWHFIFGPGTIGSLAWLSRNEASVPKIRGGLVTGLLGDPGALTYKRSRRGTTPTDRAVAYALAKLGAPHRLTEFEPYGYDERQFCSPGFDLPVGRLTRSPNGQYPEYHSSGDDLTLISEGQLAESIRALAHVIGVLDENRTVINLLPKGEPRLGKRGLYGNVGGGAPAEFEHALLWVLSLSDGGPDLLAIAERSGLDFYLIARAAAALEDRQLVRTCAPATQQVSRKDEMGVLG